MKTLQKTIKVYTYSELSESAKEKVKQMILDDEIRNDMFYEQVIEDLNNTFRLSDLKVTYSLLCRQGDGLNVYGTLNLYDFVSLWNANKKSKRTIEFYLGFLCEYKFYSNNLYCYSCKFIDKKYIDDEISEHIDILEYNQIKNINTELLTKFYNDMIDYFTKFDAQLNEEGYNFFYEISDEEAEEECEAYEWYFDESGGYINTFEYVEV